MRDSSSSVKVEIDFRGFLILVALFLPVHGDFKIYGRTTAIGLHKCKSPDSASGTVVQNCI